MWFQSSMATNRPHDTSIVRIFLVFSCLLVALVVSHSMEILSVWDHFSFVASPKQPFDSIVWKESDEGLHHRRRVKMVDDLLVKHQLSGMTMTEIQSLLGIPNAIDGLPVNDYIYYLGPERSIPWFYPEYLYIRFKDGKVERVSIRKQERVRD
jgi:hypothetical protein